MRLQEILTERVSDIVYHYTSLTTAIKILNSGVFQLSSTIGSIEQDYAPVGYHYFLSTTRTKIGGYHSMIGSSAVMFNIDGRYYNHNYKSKAVDYWGDRNTATGGRPSEAEDRIFSKTPTIPIDGITSLHLYMEPMHEKDRENWGKHLPAYARKLLILAKKKGIKTYFYEDKDAWRLQNKNKVIPITQSLETLYGPEHKGRIHTGRSYLEPWIELMFKNNKKDLSKTPYGGAGKLAYDLVYSYSYEDNNDYGLKNEMSNARKPDNSSREHAIKIIKFMKDNNLNTILDFVRFLKSKWKNIYNIKN